MLACFIYNNIFRLKTLELPINLHVEFVLNDDGDGDDDDLHHRYVSFDVLRTRTISVRCFTRRFVEKNIA